MVPGLFAAALVCGTPQAASAQTVGGQPAAAKARAGKRPAPAVKLDVVAMRAGLLSADVDRAASAAAQLGDSRQPGVLDALLDALALGVHPRVAEAALGSLAKHQAPESIATLLHYAHNRTPEVRAQAVRALGGLKDARAQAAWRAAFSDGDAKVRAAAASIAAARKDTASEPAMLALLKKGDEAMVTGLAAVGRADTARKVAEMAGEAPDALVAQCLGAMLLRTDLGPESTYVEIVRAIGKIPGDDAVIALTGYISSIPETSPRQSRREAQTIYEQRLGGGN